MIRTLLLCLAVAAFYPVSALSDDETRLDVETLIANIISGIDYSGQEIFLSGVALSASGPNEKLINLGSQQTYESGRKDNYVAVYDVGVNIAKGTAVTLKIHIEVSYAAKLGEETFVMIESTFLECVSCKK